MRPPPTALFGAPRPTEQPAAGRRGLKAARRAMHAQCDRCLVNGTATVTAGRITSLNLAAEFDRGCWRHPGCGGTFALFDIEVGE